MSGGGFIPERDLDAGPSATHVHPTVAPRQSSPPPLRRLTAKQEGRLMAYVDEQMLNVEREFNKRADPSGALASLDALITRLEPLLELVLQIPPIDPTSALRISYLLRLTSGLALYITGYPLLGKSTEHDASSRHRHYTQLQKDQAMEQVLDLLEELDRGWQAVLRGEAWFQGHERSREGSWRAGTVDGDDVRQVILGKGLTQTDRIRLRSAILALREKIIPWAERYSASRQPNSGPGGDTDTDTDLDEDGQTTEDFGQVASSWEGRLIRAMNNTLQMLTDLGKF